VIQASSWGLGLAPLAASPEGEEAHAESLEDAARLAREIQLDPDSLATHFAIRDAEDSECEMDANREPPWGNGGLRS